ncbi:MAG: hypothetical protein K9N55_04970 [Phycisphaerae bacterium]|nr:hypothetical protein [Phycisphaerae bacterium]
MIDPLENYNSDYNQLVTIYKNITPFFRRQDDEDFEKKDAVGQIPINSSSHRTVLQKDQGKDSLLW